MAFDFTCLPTFQPNIMAAHSSAVGSRLVTTLNSFTLPSVRSRSCTSTPPTTDLTSCSASAPRPSFAIMSRRFFFLGKNGQRLVAEARGNDHLGENLGDDFRQR